MVISRFWACLSFTKNGAIKLNRVISQRFNIPLHVSWCRTGIDVNASNRDRENSFLLALTSWGFCWEIINRCLFSTLMWGVRAASASRRLAVLDWFPCCPCPCQHHTREVMLCRGLRAAATQYDCSIMAVCPFLLASFVHHPSGERQVGTWWDADWDETLAGSSAAAWEMRNLLCPGPCLPWDLSWWRTSQCWFWCAGERRILLLVWWRRTKCKPTAKIQDVMLWG